ncbi:sensor histidine kinase [Allosalinactinospora lopnorensis]|uniref:sensor histidine kinase n=1 Tax=Allosalinactinospora lopnorensis TaxID=1352348 RepID=UPI000A772BEF|nr:histidine kinase [Allosalinactinospora lopnorensis]
MGIWRWWWERRFRAADWLYACALYPWMAMFNLAALETVGDPWIGGVVSPLIAPLLQPLPGLLNLLIFAKLVMVLPGVVSVTVLFRRSRPGLLLTAALVLLLVFGNPVAVPLALYSYAVWFSNRRALAGWTGAMAVGPVVGVPPTNGLFWVLFVWIVFIALPLTIGLWVGTRRELIANLRERAERLEHERHLETQRAVFAERTRIAREMHDVVAHRVSMMVLHAGGLEVSAAEQRTVEAAALIRGTGREALAELREILGVLRDDPGARAPTAPQPLIADLRRLVDEWRGAGMAIDWRTDGTVRNLPARVERTAYRTVQEALTNASKHALGAGVSVRLYYGEENLDMAVANVPPPETAGPRPEPPPSSGYGLAGLRERVALAGGELTAGPCPDGRWKVHATVPVAQPEDTVGALRTVGNYGGDGA